MSGTSSSLIALPAISVTPGLGLTRPPSLQVAVLPATLRGHPKASKTKFQARQVCLDYKRLECWGKIQSAYAGRKTLNLGQSITRLFVSQNFLAQSSFWKIDDVKQMYSHSRQVYLHATARSTVNFPSDYVELLDQVKDATQAALKDSKKLLEIEFPTAGLESVSGDAEGVIEMNTSMMMIREFCLNFISNEQYARTRIFFPDINEVAAAKTSVFEGTYFKLDYLTKPSGLEDIGFSKKVKMADRLKPTDEIIVVAYPYFNVNEMLAVEDLYQDAAAEANLPIIVFNGELDRIRSGYYPPFFYPKLAALSRNFLPKFETVYYIHNFKGRLGGTLFRAYPGPWQVLRKKDDEYVCLLQRDTMPSLKEVALEILPYT